jgi:anti-sigma B factor antagonist
VGTDHARPVEPVHPRRSPAVEGVAVTVEPRGQGWLIVYVSGELDMVTAPSLRAEVVEIFDRGAVDDRVLVFDLTSVDFIGSSGLAVLAEAVQRAENAGLPPIRLVVSSRAVLRTVEVTGMDAVLAIFPDLSAATAD